MSCLPPPLLPQLDSAFTHDAVRRRDRVYVASTGDGRVLELEFPGLHLVSCCGSAAAGPALQPLVHGAGVPPSSTRKQAQAVRAGGSGGASMSMAEVGHRWWLKRLLCSARQVQAHALFSPEQHVSTLGPDASGKLWAVLHNQGAPSSDIVQVGVQPAAYMCRGAHY